MSGNQKDLDNHANQLNPNNPTYYTSRDPSAQRPNDWESNTCKWETPYYAKADLDNHGNQCNPNNYEYNHSRQAGSK